MLACNVLGLGRRESTFCCGLGSPRPGRNMMGARLKKLIYSSFCVHLYVCFLVPFGWQICMLVCFVSSVEFVQTPTFINRLIANFCCCFLMSTISAGGGRETGVSQRMQKGILAGGVC